MEIRAKAEIIFYEDKFEKPVVILTGRWSAREVNKASGILAREYKRHIRAIQKGETTVRDAPLSEEVALEGEPTDTENIKEEANNGS